MADSASSKSALIEMAEDIFNLSTAAWRMRHVSKGTSDWDLSETEFLTLDLLARAGTMNVGAVQRQIGVLPAQMSRIVRALEGNFDQPLIAGAINPDDKRKVDISLTEAGRKAHGEFRAARLGQTVEIFGRLPEKDIRDFMRIMRSIRKQFAVPPEADK